MVMVKAADYQFSMFSEVIDLNIFMTYQLRSPIKIIFAAFLYHAYNECAISGTFLLVFKLGDVKQIHKSNERP